MSDFIQGGWSLFIAAITIIGIMACIWLLFSQSKKSVEIDIGSS
jgi:cytochrome c oxidase cbb3-type subunit 3